MSHVARKSVFLLSEQVFENYEVEGLYQLCIKSIGTDQLHSLYTADQHLCFCICKKLVFS